MGQNMDLPAFFMATEAPTVGLTKHQRFSATQLEGIVPPGGPLPPQRSGTAG